MDTIFRIETDKLIIKWSNIKKKDIVPLTSPTPIPGKLIITGRRNNIVFEKIWRSGPPGTTTAGVEVKVGPHLFEQTDYKVYAKSKSGNRVSIMHRDPLISRSFSVEDGGKILYGVVNFGSQIGCSEFSIIIDGEPEIDIQVEVFPTKLDYATDYQQLLAEVQDIITGLALEYLRSTFQLGQEFKTPQPTHVEWLLLLRHVADELERALQHIAQQPVRSLTRELVSVRTEKIKSIDSIVRSMIRRGGGSGSFIKLGKGYLVKERLMAQQARQTLDTPEHRWLARQLLRLSQRIGLLRREESIQPKTERRHQVLNELDKLEARLTRLSKLRPFAESSTDLPIANFASLQLLGAPGYREAYRCCIILSMGLRIEGGPIKLSVKDLSLLYEYWCYVALLRLISEELGCSIPVKDLFAVKQRGIQVLLEKGREKAVQFSAADRRKITVSYNPKFYGESILIPQQPDLVITLEDPKWQRLHLILDAKYRVEASDKYLERYLSPGPPEDAVNIMHRYRDAILEYETASLGDEQPKRTVIHAAAVFPFREQQTDDFRNSLLWKSLDKIGVGALPALPGSMEYLREWLNSFLRRGGWALADRAIEHRGREIIKDWRLAASESVLIGELRSTDEAQHLEWIIDNNKYYMPLLKTQKRQFTARWLAIYVSKSFDGQGAVAYWAPIMGIEIVKRKNINTPWPARDDGDKMQALYKLGPLKKLPKPIANKDAEGRPQRFSTHRWTSRLALERAEILPELLIETEPEWRLYEDLQAADKKFKLLPDKVIIQDLDVPFGRVWFLLENGLKIRYAGASGYIVKQMYRMEKYFMRLGEVLSYLEKSIS